MARLNRHPKALRGSLQWLGRAYPWLLGAITAALLVGCASKQVRPVKVFLDPDTGCHWYRVGPRGEYLIPRRDRSGWQLCEPGTITPTIPAPEDV